MFRRIVLAALLMMMAAVPLGAGNPEKLTLHVSPSVAFAPANLVVRAMITADPDNRAMAIVAESTEFYRSSEIQLEGDRAPRTSLFEFRSLPHGTYEVKAVLIGTGGRERASVRQQVNVMASGGGR